MASEQFTNGYALLIGVNENLIPGYALPTVANDVTALRDVLVHPQRCAYPRENVRLLLGSQASRQGIRAGLAWLKERLAADRSDNATAVLFYSGHGAYDRSGNDYFLLPYDLRQPLGDSLLRAADIAAEIEHVRPRRLLVILDCCHAGGMGIKGEDPFAASGLGKAAAPAEARPVVALARGQGRAVLSSSTAEENSYIRRDRSMSIFTYHLLGALTGHASGDGARDVLVSDVMGYVSRRVPESARADYHVSQTPVFQLSGENFPVALLLGGQGLAKGSPAPDPLAALPAVRTNGGAYFAGPVAAGGDVHAGRNRIGGDAIKGSQVALSGDVRGAALNIESQLANVTQAIMAAPLNGETRAWLNTLAAALEVELRQVPPERAGAAEALAARLARVTDAVESGDGELADIASRALERAAAVLADVRPAIPAVVRQLTAALRRELA